MIAETLAPDRSYDQRMEALVEANRIRSFRRGLKEDMKQGRCSIVEVLEAPPPELGSMKVRELLVTVPKIGSVKMMKMLGVTKISASKTVGGLSERQRRELARLLSRTVHGATGLASPCRREGEIAS